MAGDEIRRWSVAERAEGLKRGVSGRLGGTDRCAASLRNRSRGQGGPGITEDDELPWSRDSPSNEPGAIPARWGLGSGAKNLGSSLGLRRCSCEGFPELRCGGGAWPRRRVLCSGQGKAAARF